MKPVKKHEWSPKKCQCILALIDIGRVTIAEIIEYIKVLKSTIYDIKSHSTPFSQPRIGCPKYLSATDKRHLRRYIIKSHKNRRSGSDTIKKALDFTCSEAMIIKALHELGFYRRIARRHLALSQVTKKKCLEYARLQTHARDTHHINKLISN